MTSKICNACHKEFTLDLFHSGRGNCKKCQANSSKEWRKRNPDKTKGYKITAMYGISLDEYDRRMSTSDCCENCGTSEDLVYDHDHTTMEFRGVLCSSCNRSLGQLGDTAECVQRLLNYLMKESKDDPSI